jgi:DNA ligase-1
MSLSGSGWYPVGLDAGKLDSKEAIAMRKYFSGLISNKQEFLMAFHRRSTDATHSCKDVPKSNSSNSPYLESLLC